MAYVKNILVLILIAAGVFLLFYFSAPESSVYQEQPLWTIALESENFSGQRGNAAIYQEKGRIKIILTLSPGAPDQIQPAYIQDGDCNSPPRDSARYRLNDVTSGESQTILDVPAETLKAELPLSIRIGRSREEIYTGALCGTIGK